MAIQFARCEYVSRRQGGHACRKAAYNQRASIRCERTGEVFYFKHQGGHVYHNVLLPEGVHERFKVTSLLWNAVEKMERRLDSQVARELILALPDEKEMTLEDKIQLTQRFAKDHFVSKGVAVQIDIHAPHQGDDKNWHAHLLLPTRRFRADGEGLHPLKARDLDPCVRGGRVIEAERWGELWKACQNAYFEERGLDVRVDPIAVVPGIHLGPVRMRRHLTEAHQHAALLKQANEKVSIDPDHVLTALTRHQAVFRDHDLQRFVQKHVPKEAREKLLQHLYAHKDLVPLTNHSKGEEGTRDNGKSPTDKSTAGLYTTSYVRSDEEKLLRFAERLYQMTSPSPQASIRTRIKATADLSNEQEEAYEKLLSDKSHLSLMVGRAGVGKSYVLSPVREAFEAQGRKVIGLAPTHHVAHDLRDKGFKGATTCHAFLFHLKNQRLALAKGTVLVVEEAGMMSSELLIELFHAAHQHRAKLLLVGDDRQLASIERGGMFGVLCERYGAATLTTIQRQEKGWERQVAQHLAQGRLEDALALLDQHERLHFHETKAVAMAELLSYWSHDEAALVSQKLILAPANRDVEALNAGAREILRLHGALGSPEYTLQTERGSFNFCVGEQLLFTKTDRRLGILNGMRGTLQAFHKDRTTDQVSALEVNVGKGSSIMVPLKDYVSFQYGYASTVYRAQGATLDRVYVLHEAYSHRALSYVALTRHRKEAHLFVAQETTRDRRQLAEQMSRESGKESSLRYKTRDEREKEIASKKSSSPPGTFQAFQAHLAKLLWDIKDRFHTNKAFYSKKEPRAIPLPQNIKSRQSAFSLSQDREAYHFHATSFQSICRTLERRLTRRYHEREGAVPTGPIKSALIQQAERASDYIQHHLAHKKLSLTPHDLHLYEARAERELKRMEELKERPLSCSSYKRLTCPHERYLYHERLASIKGRLCEEHARATGQHVPLRLFQNRALSLIRHHEAMKPFLAQQYQLAGLSSVASQYMADLLHRFDERFGQGMTHKTHELYKELACYLEKRTQELTPDHLAKEGITKHVLLNQEVQDLRRTSLPFGKLPEGEAREALQKSALQAARFMQRREPVDLLSNRKERERER